MERRERELRAKGVGGWGCPESTGSPQGCMLGAMDSGTSNPSLARPLQSSVKAKVLAAILCIQLHAGDSEVTGLSVQETSKGISEWKRKHPHWSPARPHARQTLCHTTNLRCRPVRTTYTTAAETEVYVGSSATQSQGHTAHGGASGFKALPVSCHHPL